MNCKCSFFVFSPARFIYAGISQELCFQLGFHWRNSWRILDSSSELCWDRGNEQEQLFKAWTLNSGILAGLLMEVENWLYQLNQRARQDFSLQWHTGTDPEHSHTLCQIWLTLCFTWSYLNDITLYLFLWLLCVSELSLIWSAGDQ